MNLRKDHFQKRIQFFTLPTHYVHRKSKGLRMAGRRKQNCDEDYSNLLLSAVPKSQPVVPCLHCPFPLQVPLSLAKGSPGYREGTALWHTLGLCRPFLYPSFHTTTIAERSESVLGVGSFSNIPHSISPSPLSLESLLSKPR